MKKAFLFLAAGAVLFTACKKDDNNNAGTRATMVSGQWAIDSFKILYMAGGQTLLSTDLLATSRACDRDNLLDFISDNTLYADEGATKCDPSTPQRQQAGTWQLTNSEKEITINLTNSVSSGLPAGTNALTIDELTSSRMNLRKDSSLSYGGFPATASIRLYLRK
ncbi:MAG: hypothetical protein EOP52_02855 [Sphingobacteriales bacterium]|nr:MAG: hypothetical protein EOP52_02855 [Sphingobacteriales bacterium]